jgi:hypothetical protein
MKIELQTHDYLPLVTNEGQQRITDMKLKDADYKSAPTAAKIIAYPKKHGK